MLSGDHVLPRITPNIPFHPQAGADPLGEYLESLDKLNDYDEDEVLPAHEHRFVGLRDATRRTARASRAALRRGHRGHRRRHQHRVVHRRAHEVVAAVGPHRRLHAPGRGGRGDGAPPRPRDAWRDPRGRPASRRPMSWRPTSGANNASRLFDLTGPGRARSPAAAAGSDARWRWPSPRPAPTSSWPVASRSRATPPPRRSARPPAGGRSPTRATSATGTSSSRWSMPRTPSSARSTSWSTTRACRRSTTRSSTSPRRSTTRCSTSTSRDRSGSRRWSQRAWPPADGGSIINVSSVAAIRPTPDVIPYAAAKAGLEAMTIAFAKGFGPKVRVNCIEAGAFLTDISKAWDLDAFNRGAKVRIPLQRGGRATRDRRYRPVSGQRRVELHERRSDPRRRRLGLTLPQPRRRRTTTGSGSPVSTGAVTVRPCCSCIRPGFPPGSSIRSAQRLDFVVPRGRRSTCAGTARRTSPTAAELYSYELMATDVVAFLDALGLDAVYALGQSLGGGVSTLVDRLQPGRITKLMLCEGIAHPVVERPEGHDNFMASIARKRRPVWASRAAMIESYGGRPPLNELAPEAAAARTSSGAPSSGPMGRSSWPAHRAIEAAVFEAAARAERARTPRGNTSRISPPAPSCSPATGPIFLRNGSASRPTAPTRRSSPWTAATSFCKRTPIEAYGWCSTTSR